MDINGVIGGEFKKALEYLTQDPRELDKDIDKNRAAYKGKHAILTDFNRRDKQVGDTPKTRRIVKHAKEVLTLQKRIVNSAVQFLFGTPLTLVLQNDTGKDAFAVITDIWKKNKLDYFNKSLARELFVERKAAELWHVPPTATGTAKPRARVTLLTKKNGYRIYPHFDEYGDMDAFTILYNTTDSAGKPVDNATIYTALKIIDAKKSEGNEWVVTPRNKTGENILGLIPIVYYEQEETEWEGVGSEINRMEDLISNFADTNDYFGSPVLQSKGIIENLPKKEETGKAVSVKPELGEDGKIYYPGGIEFITWDRAPEAIVIEYNILKDIVYGQTSTPDLSFSNVKGMTNLSGIAIRLMMTDALNKAKDKQEVFGPATERRISILKTIAAKLNVSQATSINSLEIDIVFNESIPQDDKEIIDALSIARGGNPTMSEQTAVRRNPMVTDPESDLEKMKSDRDQVKNLGESYLP